MLLVTTAIQICLKKKNSPKMFLKWLKNRSNSSEKQILNYVSSKSVSDIVYTLLYAIFKLKVSIESYRGFHLRLMVGLGISFLPI